MWLSLRYSKNGQFFLKYHFLCHRRFTLEEIQLSVNYYVSIFNFTSPKDYQHYSSLHSEHLGGTSQDPLKGFPNWRWFNVPPESKNKKTSSIYSKIVDRHPKEVLIACWSDVLGTSQRRPFESILKKNITVDFTSVNVSREIPKS